MEQQKKFILFVSSLFAVIGIITLIEMWDFNTFARIFLYLKNYASWFIGITFGFVFANIISFFKKEAEHILHQPPREEFVFFILNLVMNVFFISLAHGAALYLFNTFFELFHVLFVQWIALVYICFKLVNKYPVSLKYLLATEINVIVYTALILFTVVR